MKKNRFLHDLKRRKFVWGSMAAFCLIVAFWWYDTNRDPNIVIPPAPSAPKPNGFDYFVQAANVYVPEPQSLTIQEQPELDAQNPQAFIKSYPLQARKKWLRQNAQTLKLLRQGLKYQCQFPPRTSATQSYSKFRNLATLFVNESHVSIVQGDWNGAVPPALDCIRLGQTLARGEPHFRWLRGCWCWLSGVKTLDTISEHLDASIAKNTAHELHKLTQTIPSATDAIREEKWEQLQSYHNIFSQSNWRSQFAGIEAGGENMALFLDSMMTGRKQTYWDTAKVWGVYAKGRVRMLSYSKRRLTQNYIDVADAAITASQKPYRNIKPARGADIFSDIFVNAYQRLHWSATVSNLKQSQLAAALALRAYKLENGSYPASLNELVPAYLPSAPQDVFANQPLRYKRDGANYKLWSIGPDMKDDGGKPARDTTKFPNRQTIVDSASTGDFVYGVNR